MHTQNLGFYLVASFLIINLIIGLWFGRKSTTMRDYALANKSYSTGPLVMTYLATVVGGGWIFIRPQEMYEYGIGSYIYMLSSAIGMFLCAMFIAPRMLQFRKCVSVGDMFGTLFGENEKIFVGIVAALFNVIVAGLQVACLGNVFEQFLGIDGWLGIVISGTVLAIYASIGGMKAVVATDLLQFVLLLGFLITLSVLSVKKVGCIKDILSNIPADRFDFWGTKNFYSYLSLIVLSILFPATVLVDPPRLDRMLMAKSPWYMRRMLYVAGAGVILIISLILLISFSALALYPNIDSSKIVLYLVQNLVPDNFRGLVTLGILAVLFSTGDSYIHSAGVGLSKDVLQPIYTKLYKEERFNDLRLAKWSTLFASLFVMSFALWGKKLFRVDYMLGVVTPILAAPLILSIFGIKPEKRAFWVSCSASVLSFFWCKISLYPPYDGLSLLIPVVTNAIVYMIVHIQINGGIMLVKHEGYNSPEAYRWKPSMEKFMSIAIYIATYPLHFAERCRNKVLHYNAPYVLFGVFYCIVLVAPYFLWEWLPEAYADTVLYMRLGGVVLCALLMTISIWPRIAVPYIPAFWYITLTYCIPFLSTMLLLFSNGSTDYIVNIAVTIMFLILLVDWGSALFMSIIGAGAAYLAYTYLLPIPVELHDAHFSFNSKYLLTYQVVFGTAIGLLFARKRESLFARQKTTIQSLVQILNTERDQLRVIQGTSERITKGLSKREIDLMTKVEALKAFCNKMKNAHKDDAAVLKEVTNGLSIASYLHDLVENAREYLKLDVEEVPLEEILWTVSQLSTTYQEGNFSIVVRTDWDSIQCDARKLKYILCDGIYEVCRHNPLGDHLIIDVSEAKIAYDLPSLKDYKKLLDAYVFTISTEQEIPQEVFQKVYDRQYNDPKAIQTVHNLGYTDPTEIPVVAKRLLDAHFGLAKVIASADGYTKIYVVPKNLKEVRPAPLELELPEEVIITWPGALDLEKNLKEQINQKAPSVDLEKIDRAIDVIKKYHAHQTRKSGEPYYLHPVHVALIELEWTTEEDAILGALLHDLLEDTAFTIFDLRASFGDRVAEIVFGVSKVDKDLRTFHSNEEHLMTLEKMTDFAVLSIKVSDRIHNMRTISGHKSEAKRKAIATETLKFFVPVAKRLGLEKAAEELEGLAMGVLG